jgi:hypothetical protein
MGLLCRDSAISENHQIQPFMVGLGHQFRTDVTLHKSMSLDEVVMYAQAYAQRDTSRALPPPLVGRSTSRTYTHQPAVPTTSG